MYTWMSLKRELHCVHVHPTHNLRENASMATFQLVHSNNMQYAMLDGKAPWCWRSRFTSRAYWCFCLWNASASCCSYWMEWKENKNRIATEKIQQILLHFILVRGRSEEANERTESENEIHKKLNFVQHAENEDDTGVHLISRYTTIFPKYDKQIQKFRSFEAHKCHAICYVIRSPS